MCGRVRWSPSLFRMRCILRRCGLHDEARLFDRTNLTSSGPPFSAGKQQDRTQVREGRLTIARQFSGGITNGEAGQVPEARLNTVRTSAVSVVPPGLALKTNPTCPGVETPGYCQTSLRDFPFDISPCKTSGDRFQLGPGGTRFPPTRFSAQVPSWDVTAMARATSETDPPPAAPTRLDAA